MAPRPAFPILNRSRRMDGITKIENSNMQKQSKVPKYPSPRIQMQKKQDFQKEHSFLQPPLRRLCNISRGTPATRSSEHVINIVNVSWWPRWCIVAVCSRSRSSRCCGTGGCNSSSSKAKAKAKAKTNCSIQSRRIFLTSRNHPCPDPT